MSDEPELDSAEEVLGALAVERGHYRYESGHHGDLWLELDELVADGARRGRRA